MADREVKEILPRQIDGGTTVGLVLKSTVNGGEWGNVTPDVIDGGDFTSGAGQFTLTLDGGTF